MGYERVFKILQSVKSVAHIILLAAFLVACTQDAEHIAQNSLQEYQRLALEAIFTDKAYEPEKPGQIRWLDDGSGYTTLETLEAYIDAELEKDENGDDIKAPEDIVFYDPQTLDREVLVSAQRNR